MRLGKLTALTVVIIFMIAVLGGCSKDKSTTNTTPTYGSLDDPVFVPIQTQINDELTGIVSDILSGFDNLYVIPGDDSSVQAQLTPPSVIPDPEASPDTLIAVYDGGWHYIYATYLGETYLSRLRDSIQYLEGTTPVQEPSAQVDGIHYINNWTFTSLTPEVTHTDYTGRNDFLFSHVNQSTAVVSGNSANVVEMTYVGVDSSITKTFSFDATFTNLNVSQIAGTWLSGCPNSGTVNMDLSYVYTWENDMTFGSGSANWTVVAYFDSGTASVYANNGVETWHYFVDICTVRD